MEDVADELVRSLNLEEIERIRLPRRSEVRQPIPEGLLQGLMASELQRNHPDNALWRHQSVALDLLGQNKNVVVATGTASGKSLIFQYRALDLICRNSRARVLVFYPLKALAADQFQRWQTMCKRFGLSEDAVQRIDGDVLQNDRTTAIERANIILMTPDVCQAWMMRNVASGAMRRFLGDLSLLVLDEAHIYESVFGSNVAFLLRRLISAKRHVAKTTPDALELQILAATATIADAGAHLQALSGLPFEVVDEVQNGAPLHDRILLHVGGAEYGSSGEQALADVVKGIINLSHRRRFIAFIDSRQGTERVVREIGSPHVLPYRSGYEGSDRAKIERSLRDGSLHGVVSTSALELGIDIPDMEIGINLGVPDTRKSFRQRIGRVGRSGPGLFLVIASPSSFTQFGETFSDYYDSSVEPSYLYTGNRFIQFAHARCLWDELEVLKQDGPVPPRTIEWPEGFDEALKHAKRGGARPREFDYMAQLGADNPHFNYPLRAVGEANYEIKQGRGDHTGKVGNIAANQALREAFPGANYLHFGSSYRVQQWIASSFERSIRVEPTKNHVPTKPLMRKTVNLALDPGSVIDGRMRRNAKGLVAETNLQVNESVEGYRIGNSSYLYRDLRAENPNMSRKQRDIRTTGTVIMIDEPWFSSSSASGQSNRDAVGRALVGVLGRERSISPQDIDYTATNIALIGEQGPRRVNNCVVIYDAVYGGIRLTEDLFDRFGHYVELISKASDLAGSDAIVSDKIASLLAAWADTLEDADAEDDAITITPDGWYQVFRPGSVVSTYHNGSLVTREIISPKLVDLGAGAPSLFYSYKVGGKQGVLAHEQIHATGDDWSYVNWDPETNEFCELEIENVDSEAKSSAEWLKVYRPGTRMLIPQYGKMVERQIIEIRRSSAGEANSIAVEYVYAEGSGRGYVPHSKVETTGNDWSLVLWNPEKNSFKELDN